MRGEKALKNISQHFREHCAAYLLSAFIGFVMIYPQLLFMIQAQERFKGFNIFETDAEYYYIARIQGAREGDFRLANPLLKEGKNFPYVQPPLPEIIMAATGKIFGLGIPGTLMLFSIIAPAGIFLLIYFFVLEMTGGKKMAAILAPVVILLATNLVSYPMEFVQMLQGEFRATKFLIYSRPVSPQISSLFFFGWLLCFWKIVHTHKPQYFLLSLIIFGLSFYIYPYTWSFALVLMVVYAAHLLFQKRYDLFKTIIGIIFGGLILSIPYWINTYELIQHPSYEYLLTTYGLYESRKLVFSAILFISGAMLLVLYRWNSHFQNCFWFLFSMVITGFIVINQQVITGRVLYYGHYHWYFHKPLLVVIGMIFIFTLFEKFKIKKPFLSYFAVFVFVVSLYNAYHVQTVSYKYHFDRYLNYQKYHKVIGFLNENTQAGEVVYVVGSFYYPAGIPFAQTDIKPSRMLTRFIFSYTPLNVYFFTDTTLYLTPHPQYNLYNLYIVLKGQGVTPEESFAYLRDNPKIFRDIFVTYFKVRGRPYRDLTAEDVTPQRIEYALSGYKNFYKMTWNEIFSRYPLDYIVWDKNDLPFWPFEEIRQKENILQALYEDDGVIVYKFIQKKSSEKTS